MPSLRKRLEHSRLLASVLARVIGSYLRFCNWTTRWEVVGLDALKSDLQKGPVLLVMWHERSLMGPVHWPVASGQLTSLYARSAVGRVSGAMQRQFGLKPMEMRDQASNVAASRAILKRVRDGISIGMTGDGPLGPPLLVKDAPLDWARTMQRPVWTYAFSTTRGRHLKTWDSLWVPYPFGRGAIVFDHWENNLDRRASADQIEAARNALNSHLTQTSSYADRSTNKVLDTS
jgi:lysophospholipid acyltransferase (LPLAT)-like uncharacterized protein